MVLAYNVYVNVMMSMIRSPPVSLDMVPVKNLPTLVMMQTVSSINVSSHP
jgi:hypothetical protein